MVITCPKCGNKHAIYSEWLWLRMNLITVNCLECGSPLPKVADEPRQDGGNNSTDSTQHQE